MNLLRAVTLGAAAVAVLFNGPSGTYAVPIEFVHEGEGSGTLDGVPFPHSSFQIRSLADTNDRVAPSSGVFYVDHRSSYIVIDGVGEFSFLSPTRTFVSRGTSTVGFSRGGKNGIDLFNGPRNSVIRVWDMLSSTGPHVGTARLFGWHFSPVVTASGVLEFNVNNFSPAIFTATIIPEPGYGLFGGLAIVGFRSFQRRPR